MPWEIAGNLGPYTDPNYDGSGWLCELHRESDDGVDARRVFVLISRQALDAENVYDETAKAIETEGLSEVERVAAQDDPPQMISCTRTMVEDRL